MVYLLPAAKKVAGRYCFHRCLSVHGVPVWSLPMMHCTSVDGTPPHGHETSVTHSPLPPPLLLLVTSSGHHWRPVQTCLLDLTEQCLVAAERVAVSVSGNTGMLSRIIIVWFHDPEGKGCDTLSHHGSDSNQGTNYVVNHYVTFSSWSAADPGFSWGDRQLPKWESR